MFDAMKKCPFNGKQTAPFNARLKEECSESGCKFEHAGRCMIVGGYFSSLRIEEMLEKLTKGR